MPLSLSAPHPTQPPCLRAEPPRPPQTSAPRRRAGAKAPRARPASQGGARWVGWSHPGDLVGLPVSGAWLPVQHWKRIRASIWLVCPDVFYCFCQLCLAFVREAGALVSQGVACKALQLLWNCKFNTKLPFGAVILLGEIKTENKTACNWAGADLTGFGSRPSLDVGLADSHYSQSSKHPNRKLGLPAKHKASPHAPRNELRASSVPRVS